jgi:fumarate reductase flavoprotein subunit
MTKNLTRRNFLFGLGVTSAAVVGGSLGACSPSVPTNSTKATAPETKQAPVPVWEQVPDAIPESDIKETISAEVVIVGAGIAGCVAAMAAAEAKLDTVVLQKLSTPANFATGVATYASKAQIANGAPNKYDIEELLSDYMRNSTNLPDRRFIEMWRDRSGNDFDWLVDHFTEDEVAAPYWDWNEAQPLMGMFDMISAMQILAEKAEAGGAKFYYETPAVQLVREDNGKVTAVIAQNSNGDYLKFAATKGIVLCAGDYGNNPEMRAEFLPHAEGLPSAVAPAWNTGEGELIAMWIGAEMDRKPHCTNIHYDLIDGTLDQVFGAGIPWLKVNKNGKRFNNEDVQYGYVPMQDVFQPDFMHFDVFDGNYETYQPQMGDGLYRSFPSPKDTFAAPCFAEYLKEKGVDTAGMSDYDALLETYVLLGSMLRGDTLEDVAEQAGIDAVALKETVVRYNELAAKGVDEDYGKSGNYLFPIDTPPYYIVPRQAYSLSCLSGLSINLKAQVLDTEGKVIPGLYAAGNNSGGRWFAGLVQPMSIPGLPASRAIISARLAIESIVAGA